MQKDPLPNNHKLDSAPSTGKKRKNIRTQIKQQARVKIKDSESDEAVGEDND